MIKMMVGLSILYLRDTGSRYMSGLLDCHGDAVGLGERDLALAESAISIAKRHNATGHTPVEREP